MSKIPVFLISLYQKIPHVHPSPCIYYPSCSEYAKQAFTKYNFLKATGMALLRILRCNPFVRGGFDPLR